MLFTLLFTSCNRKLNKEKLVEYIKNPENGVMKDKSIGSINISVYYKPVDFLVQQELVSSDVIKNSKIEEIRENYSKNLYFQISISMNDKEVLNNAAYNRQEFGRMVNQLSFEMGNRVYLTDNDNDTLQMMNYLYPRMYGMSKSTDILFSFEKPDLKNTESLIFTIKDIGLMTGDIKFKFKTKDILEVPELKFSNI
jgi:hypothetical protein